MQIKYVFPRGTSIVPQITFLNVEKLNRIGFIRISTALDLLFYTNIDNGFWDIATVTVQCRNPELAHSTLLR